MTVLVLLLSLLQTFLETPEWRVVYLDGSVGSFRGEPTSALERKGEVQYGWVWSELATPRRIEADKLGKLELLPARGLLEVRVSPPPGSNEMPAGLRVLAGPVEMWDELPEEELPVWSVPANGRLSVPTEPAKTWRFRLAGEGAGSWWVDVAPGTRSVHLAANRAEGFSRSVVGPDRSALEGAKIFVSEGTPRTKVRGWATYRSEGGRFQVPGLPDIQSVLVTILKPGAAPAVFSGRLADLPEPLRLTAGSQVSGRLVDRHGRPVRGARIRLESWVHRSVPQVFSAYATTSADGLFAMDGLPLGSAVVSARVRGLAPVEKTLELAAGTNDAGTLVAEPGADLTVVVRGEQGETLPGVEVEAAGLTARTDSAGRARLANLPPHELTLAARGKGFLEIRERLAPPFSREREIELRRAFTLLGRLIDRPGGAPVTDGSLRIEQGGRIEMKRIDPEGRFSLSLKPEIDTLLVLSSPRLRELRLPVPRGSAGETRDLGDVAPPPGLALTGRVVREDGSPVAGASLWLPRPGPSGPAWAWAARDLLSAQSGADGGFRLTGLPPGPAVLRAEAPGLSRKHVEIALEEGEENLDVGEIRLSAGGAVRVLLAEEEETEGAMARADLRGSWLDSDMVSAPVRHGEASLRHLPPGPVTISVLAGFRMLCERSVRVEAGEEKTVDCRRKELSVAGLVLMGGEPVAGGVLAFLPPAPTVPGRIDHIVSPGGLRQQQVFGLGRPQIDVPVGGDGTFVTSDLVPGTYTVVWSPSAGESSPEHPLVIPDVAHHEAVIDLPGQLVRGRVLDDAGRSAPGARIAELASGALAFAADDGSFSLTGLKPGKASFQARRDELASEVVEMTLAVGRPAEPLVLSLGPSQPHDVAVIVLDENGRGVSGAFVFLEEEGKGQRILTTGPDGTVTAGLEAPLPGRLRAAVTTGGAWGFAPWRGLAEAREGLTVSLLPTGTLVLASRQTAGGLRLETRGFDLSWLLTQLGNAPRVFPENPAVLAGLPAGDFTVHLGPVSRRVSVPAGETVRLELD